MNEIGQLQRIYKLQLEYGCNGLSCTNFFCHRKLFCKKAETLEDLDADIDRIAEELARTHIQYDKDNICKYLSPMIMNPKILEVVQDLNRRIMRNSNIQKEDFQIFKLIFNDINSFQFILKSNNDPTLNDLNLDLSDTELSHLVILIMKNYGFFKEFIPLLSELIIVQFRNAKPKKTRHFLRGVVLAAGFSPFICNPTHMGSFLVLMALMVKYFLVPFCNQLSQMPRTFKNFVATCLNAISIILFKLTDSKYQIDGKTIVNQWIATISQNSNNPFHKDSSSSILGRLLSDICNVLQQLSHYSNNTDIFIHQQLTEHLQINREFNLYSSKQSFSFLDTPAVLAFDFRKRCYFIKNPIIFSNTLTISLRRNKLMTDLRKKFLPLTISELRREIRIYFEGEDAIDLGGVRREFFDLVGQIFADLRNGLLRPLGNQYVWFHNECSIKPQQHDDKALLTIIDEEWLRILGILAGLCIRYQGDAILNIKFPLFLYKALMKREITQNDLKEVYPEIISNFELLTNYTAEQLEEADLYFSVTSIDNPVFDNEDNGFVASNSEIYKPKMVNVDLIENGSKIKVTKNNVRTYISKYVSFLISKLFNKNYNAFYQGFVRVVGSNCDDWFSPWEISKIISGSDYFDWNMLMKKTIYFSGYTSKSLTVILFWDIFFNKLNDEEQKKLFFFVTGLRSAPIGGMESIEIQIHKIKDISILPTAHTCVMSLMLPDYQKADVLERSLRVCIQNAEGFGFK